MKEEIEIGKTLTLKEFKYAIKYGGLGSSKHTMKEFNSKEDYQFTAKFTILSVVEDEDGIKGGLCIPDYTNTNLMKFLKKFSKKGFYDTSSNWKKSKDYICYWNEKDIIDKI